MHANRRTFIRRSSAATAGLFGVAAATPTATADEPADDMALVEGQLRYGESPAGDVTVAFDEDTSTETASNGRYDQELEPGTYTVAVDEGGYVADTEEIELEAGDTTSVTFDLEREWGPEEGEIEVAIVEPGGGSTLESRVTIFGNGETHSVVAPNGRLPDGERWTTGLVVPEGWWEIHVEGVEGYGDGYEEVYVEAGEDVRALIDLAEQPRPISKTALVSGEITDEDGDPVDDATVRLRGERSTRVETTDEDGEFDAKLEHGQYTLDVFADGYDRAETDVVARFGRMVEPEITLETD
ncbi:carboxypeptidase regulatory-like domain-containing protein [Natronolimnobius sp. AArcel1]|uniref:carboxypeptidase-like regulatory domain-containing protein n=1 Tax=Natronolimnobius sp. AArcel1 TaxID=1679093 RepID=UPI0013ED2125|nr:carboxypeptidase-like regulatory domain-containing protein [Natronolimnobius sp. AArcel1]NGM69901.1 carboxypeptidase regulatory-like domain-containing protein [Natronolimnobius sp. AArcel1]